jgi:phosphate/sulfate permease
MKQMILSVAIIAFAAGSAFAHGNAQHVMGTVTAVTEDSITVKTKAKDPVTVYTMPDTKYEKSGAAASMKDLKIGDRVVIHAAMMNNKLMANEVSFGAVTKTTRQP